MRIDFTETRRLVQQAITRGEVIKIHPLDMAIVLSDPTRTEPFDLVIISLDNGEKERYFYVEGRTYLQTTAAQREEPCN